MRGSASTYQKHSIQLRMCAAYLENWPKGAQITSQTIGIIMCKNGAKHSVKIHCVTSCCVVQWMNPWKTTYIGT